MCYKCIINSYTKQLIDNQTTNKFKFKKKKYFVKYQFYM